MKKFLSSVFTFHRKMSRINKTETCMVYKLSEVTVVDEYLKPKYPNDVLCCLPSDRPASECESHVVFFGGDTQDYEDNMKAHRDNHKYSRYNLTTTALVLQRKFPRSCIWVIKPSKMYLNTFAAYHNFVRCNDFGNPSFDENGSGLLYLKLLLRVCLQKMASTLNEEFVLRTIDLVAFSKGCVVLNQFLYEFTRKEPELITFIKRIRSMYWLDGGHSGGRDTWVTEEHVLHKIKHLDLSVHVHTTPYQMDDDNRAWIGEEKRKMVSTIRKLGRRVEDIMHFVEEPRSIENHFKVLTCFK